MRIDELLGRGVPPVIAILRGVKPAEAVAIGIALSDAGIRIIEVPLNSPDPLRSIADLQEALGADAAIGAGTVTSPAAVDAVVSTGAGFIVTPNTNPDVIRRALAAGLEPMPGFFTASEAFAAVAAGARRLKLFPASSIGAGHIRALTEVLPAGVEIWAVGGTGADNLGQWLGLGAAGIGVGSGLYRAGDSPMTVAQRARASVEAWQAVRP